VFADDVGVSLLTPSEVGSGSTDEPVWTGKGKKFWKKVWKVTKGSLKAGVKFAAAAL
jgi:hypothetical protein